VINYRSLVKKLIINFQASSVQAILPFATCYHSVVCPSVCMSFVTLMHRAKAVGRNEMPFAGMLL